MTEHRPAVDTAPAPPVEIPPQPATAAPPTASRAEHTETAGAGGARPEAATTAPPPPAPPAPARRSGRLGRLILLGLCTLGGVAGGTAVRLNARGPETAPSPDKPPRTPETPPPLEVLPPTVRLDTLIRSGNFDEALELCHTLAAGDPRALAYREAICLEGLGQWKEAGEAYHRAEEHEADAAAWCRAVLGRTRCAAAQEDLATARKLLNRVSLRSGHPDCRGRNILAECLHLRGRIEVLGLGGRRRPDPLDPTALAWPDLTTPAEVLPESLPTGLPAESPAAPEVGSGRVEVRPAESPHDEPRVTAHLPPQPAVAHLGTVAAAAKLKLRVEPPADKGLPAESTGVDVELAPLGEVLSALVGPDAGWRIEGDVLVLGAPPDRRASALGALRRAFESAPNHPVAAAAQVTVGNLEVEAGRFREATTEYRELLEQDQHAREALHAAYNLGLVELRQQNLPAARGRFLEVVDRGRGETWADLGWWWVARTHLDVGDTAAARKPLQNALGSKSRAVASGAALGLCACDLLDGDDASAREVLEDHRIGPAEAHISVGELFEALLRYRAMPTPGRAETVVAAARHADEARRIGLAGVVLVGTTYRATGETNRMIALYEREVDSARGPLAARMTFEVAERFDATDLRHEARQRYLIVAAIDPKGFGPTAELRVAALAARDGRGWECVRRCRALLEREGVERNDLLAVMGRGYELVRDHRRAAECFAGQVPAE